MKRYVLALAALITLSAGAVTTAKAVESDVGPGGVYVGQHRYHDYDRGRRYYGSYNRYDQALGTAVVCGVTNARALTAGPAYTKPACNGGQRS